MDFNFQLDISLIQGILNVSREQLSEAIGVSGLTLLRIERGDVNPDVATLDKIYGYAYKKGLKLNEIKEDIYKEENVGQKILFHGSKSVIEGEISPFYGREKSDFGHGFYCGESVHQAISFVSRHPNSSLYVLAFDDKGLKTTTFNVDDDWMLAVAYYRGTLLGHSDHPIIKEIRKKVETSDYIIAPIADNRMFNIVDQFISGYITDAQCKHCLAASKLGNQYVFLTEKAVKNLTIGEKCFISNEERKHYLEIRKSDIQDGENKVKAALIKYKREGQYIEEILR